ncbi:MAG: hypothetical protein IJX85_05115 [Lachnospiraceae bacterium]|nr:hypothetical protein [Lachnospiraceae bacterium]
MDENMIAILYLISLGVFFIFLVIATISVIAGSIKKKSKRDYDDYEEDDEEDYPSQAPVANTVKQNVDIDIFDEAVMEATQIANETAVEVKQAIPVQQTAPVQTQPVAPAKAAVQMPDIPEVAPVIAQVPSKSLEESLAQDLENAFAEESVNQADSAFAETVANQVDSAFAETPVAPSDSSFVEQPVVMPESVAAETAATADSAFADSAFADSAFADSAFEDSAFADSAFADSAFGATNYDKDAFPGSAFENPTPVDPAAMAYQQQNVAYQQQNMGQMPTGNFYWFNKEDVADKPDYKPEEMYYRHFTVADECIEDLLIEMYDCALVRTEEIRYIAFGIEPRNVSLRDVAATGNAAYNAAKKKKEPTKEDLDKIYRQWCSYVDKLFEIVEFRADNTTIGIIRDKLYEFGKSDVNTIIEGK